uniref:Uncharacterized protein n=1 Tax=Heterosigma akashiwo TaxID=2829 RepID=A0A7S3UTL0_HETAK|mmetsp:Transcript_40973/g.66695  ORF Transcript_40973/g.66695 Transcript_40973/m.66695 type:complete len:158 (-) Transcript_40973:54-527(-)
MNITVTEAFFGFDRNITNLNGTAVLISKRGISRPGSTVRVHTAGLPIFIENPEEYYCYIPSDDDMKVLELWKMNPKDPEYTDGGENRPGFDEYCTKDDLYGDLIIELMILPQHMNEEGTTNNKEDSSSVDGGEEESGLGRDKTPSSAKGGGIKLETE